MDSSAPQLDDARRQQLEARLAWLGKAREEHRRSQRRAPWALVTALLAVPAAFIWHVGIAFYVLVVALSLVALVFYVAWNHEMEVTAEQDAIRVMLAGGPAAVAAAEDLVSGNTALRGDPAEARTGEEREKQRAMHARNRRPRPISL